MPTLYLVRIKLYIIMFLIITKFVLLNLDLIVFILAFYFVKCNFPVASECPQLCAYLLHIKLIPMAGTPRVRCQQTLVPPFCHSYLSV